MDTAAPDAQNVRQPARSSSPGKRKVKVFPVPEGRVQVVPLSWLGRDHRIRQARPSRGTAAGPGPADRAYGGGRPYPSEPGRAQGRVLDDHGGRAEVPAGASSRRAVHPGQPPAGPRSPAGGERRRRAGRAERCRGPPAGRGRGPAAGSMADRPLAAAAPGRSWCRCRTRGTRWACSSPGSPTSAAVASKIRRPSRPGMAASAKSHGSGGWRAAVRGPRTAGGWTRGSAILRAPRGGARARRADAR
jgi:hypothetical protein